MTPSVKLKPYISQIRGMTYKPDEIAGAPFENSVPLLKANNITDDGLDDSSLIYIDSNRIKPEQFIQAGDLLLAASSGSKKVIGKSAHFTESFGGSFGAFCKVVRPKNGLCSDYLKHFFKTSYYRSSIEKAVQGANINNLRNEHLDGLEIPLPPLDDQIRIAHLLGKVEGLIAQRKQHLQQLDDLLKSVFLEMFGDPVRNVKIWETLSFQKVGQFISGGTPSKSRPDFWSGSFPWVSPKDMKASKIKDAEDHISESVFEETTLKRISPYHVLIVVRGMILAHSFPVAINVVEISINQDMKAIKPIKDLNIVYLQNCLNSLKRQILKLISSAGHGTRKLDSSAMQKLFVPVPPMELQIQFATTVEKIEDIKTRYQQNLTDLENLYGVLSQQAFKGELDLSRIPLIHGARTVTNP